MEPSPSAFENRSRTNGWSKMLVVKAAKASSRGSWWLLLALPSILSPELAFPCRGGRGEGGET